MAHEYVKISELEPTSSFGTTDQFVIVQNEETVKIDGAALVESLATLTNLATRSYVDAVVDSAPGTLDTLRELAAALNDDANFGANITALINEKLPTANFGLEFWNQLATVNTYHISEGSNLYWTQDRFDSALASKNTYHLAEGSNLYFTTARAREALSAGEGILYNSLTGIISAPGLSSDPTFNSVTTTTLNVKNVNFTGTGAVTISSGNDLNLVAAGHVAVNGSPLVASATVDTTNAANISSGTLSNARLNAIPNSVLANSTITINGTTISLGGTNSISTSSISEGTNLYYTSGRVNADFDTRLTTKSTTDLAEGTNLYYTDARVDSYLTSNNYATKGYVGTQIANLVNSAPTTLDTLNELATALGNDANFATTVTTALGTKANSTDLAVVAMSGSYNDLLNKDGTNGPSRIAIGKRAGGGVPSQFGVSIGEDAGEYNQGSNAVAIGIASGSTSQGNYSISLGGNAGQRYQGTQAVSIGNAAGSTSQGQNSIAIGTKSGWDLQGYQSVAIGENAGQNAQGIRSVAIGMYAGKLNQGQYAVAIGPQAGENSQANNTIIINATELAVNGEGEPFRFYVAPIRSTNKTVNGLFYNTSSKEVTIANIAPNYVQADKASTSMPYGTALPATVVSGTITTTGGPVRLHISGNCMVNTGGAPVIQFQRGTTSVGRNMTLTNNGSNLSFASECIDAVPAGTYTYSVKVVSGSIGNGAIFYDPVLTIIELK